MSNISPLRVSITGYSVFGKAPEILMLVAYRSSPVVRIHSGSTEFSGFLYLDPSKSAFTSTFFFFNF